MPVGKLYIVATPIGNLDDLTYRALATLKSVDVVLCEDTRVTKKLLDHYAVRTATLSYHAHSDARRVKEILKLVEEGKNLALATDAGTPGISDPGNMLVKELAGHGVEVIPIPGASAVTAILSVAGLPTDRFTFLGFVPQKKKRKQFFEELNRFSHTVVFYESGHRIEKCLRELGETTAERRPVVVGRELTKKFETIYRTRVGQLGSLNIDTRGEFVVVLGA